MKAAILHGKYDFRIEEIPEPELKNDEYLITVKACGVCHSELHQWDEKNENLDYPRFIGHEVAGVIKKTGSETKKYSEGTPVAVWVDGKGYAEQIAVKEDQVFLLASHIPFAQAMAEPLSCTTNGVIRADIGFGDTVVLVGMGFMGLIILQEAKLRGAGKLIAVDLRDDMLEIAKNLGADVIINPKTQNAVNKVKEETGNKGADVCFEIGGTQRTLDLAAELCRMEGKLVIFGFHPGSRVIKDLGFWNWMAFDIINAHFRNLDRILEGARTGMKLLNNNKITLEPLITHDFALDRINDAFRAAKDKPEGFIKAVIIP